MYFNEDHQALRDTVARFVNKEINPYIDEWEETTAPLHELFPKLGELGLLGIRYDPKYGGQGLDYWFDTVFLEEMGHIKGMGAAAAIIDHTHMATPALHDFGSEYLKETYLMPAIKGKMVAAIGVTEPGAGSDVAGLRTRAKKDGDSYVINGSKTFITNGVQSDFVTLLTRTSDDPGYHSFSLFIVPKGLDGFVVSKKLDKMGWRSSDMAELFFEDVRVPAENLIGEEGEGFIYQMKQFQHERFSALPLTYVVCRDVIDFTVEYIKQRVVFGKPLISRQVLRHRIADWLTEIECLKQLTYHIVRLKMAGIDATREISMGKLISGELATKVTDGCLQMFGGMGYMNESLISRYYRDARGASIAGGANEIMREVITRLEGI
jgi:citronellyl-CoA dehydrogenase